MDVRTGLNEAQARALDVISGPVLILAGAGSGKTKTLTHRIAHLIANEGIWPNQILAVTFTNKAAREMRDRLSILLEQPESRSFMPWMGTFHGICVRLLRMDGEAVGVAKNFVIYDEDDRRGLIKRVMKDVAITDQQIKPQAVSAMISKAKNDLQDPDAFAAAAHYPFAREVAKIYARYEAQRRAAGALDFDDLLLETVRLFRDHPTVRNKWRDHFKHILIDEYQDTNAAQYMIVKSLVNDDRNICVVGDDWQSIYSWRGADFTNILNFERDFTGATVIKLEQNYRSTGAILDAAHSVIEKNRTRTDKKLWTAAGPGAPVQVRAANDETEEAYLVASRIATQVQIGARRYRDVAVLYRTNAQSYAIERALLTASIPYQIVGGTRFYDRAEIKDITAYLRLLVQPRDIVSFTRIVNQPKRGIGATSLTRFIQWQSEQQQDIIQALRSADRVPKLTAKARQSLVALGETLHEAQTMIADGSAPAVVIEWLLRQTNYREALRDGTPKAEEREENVDVLLVEAQRFTTLDDLLEEAALLSSVDTQVNDDAVTLMTLHAAKGLEYPVVFMVGLEEGIFPHSRVFDATPAELEEERRLCYVGMTRAREELHISYAHSRLSFGQRSYSMPSRFIADMGRAVAVVPTENVFEAARPRQDMSYDGIDVPLLEVGDRVRSLQFGNGEVIDMDGMAATIDFDNGQTKKLNLEYARLERL